MRAVKKCHKRTFQVWGRGFFPYKETGKIIADKLIERLFSFYICCRLKIALWKQK